MSTTQISLDRTVHHKTNQIRNKQLIKKLVRSLVNKGADIWMVLSCKNEVQIIYREKDSDGAPMVYRCAIYPNSVLIDSEHYVRVFDHQPIVEMHQEE